MAKHTVKTPVAGFSGPRAGVMFHQGIAEVDDSDPKQARALAYFRRKGYEVVAGAKPAKKTTKSKAPAEQKPAGDQPAETPETPENPPAGPEGAQAPEDGGGE